MLHFQLSWLNLTPALYGLNRWKCIHLFGNIAPKHIPATTLGWAPKGGGQNTVLFEMTPCLPPWPATATRLFAKKYGAPKGPTKVIKRKAQLSPLPTNVKLNLRHKCHFKKQTQVALTSCCLTIFPRYLLPPCPRRSYLWEGLLPL